jgi:hypothetical protein
VYILAIGFELNNADVTQNNIIVSELHVIKIHIPLSSQPVAPVI